MRHGMKNICLVVDSFKGSASSIQIENYLETGIYKADRNFKVTKIPITDGGEGFTRILTDYLGGEIHKTEITGAYGRKQIAQWGMADSKAIIEVAEAAGLSQREAGDDPQSATSYGLGKLILKIVKQEKPSEILIGLGGSATNDAGLGMAEAIGYQFNDENGFPVPALLKNFDQIKSIDTSKVDQDLKKIKFTGFADVVNPLLGANGATYVYGRQKGIEIDKMSKIDHQISRVAGIVVNASGHDHRNDVGSGAAGGLGFGILSFLNGQIVQSMPEMIKMLKIEETVSKNDIVVTGEGNLDAQSLDGKVSCQIAGIGKQLGVPVIGIVGNTNVEMSKLLDIGFSAVFTTTVGPKTLEQAVDSIELDAVTTAEQIFRVIGVGK